METTRRGFFGFLAAAAAAGALRPGHAQPSEPIVPECGPLNAPGVSIDFTLRSNGPQHIMLRPVDGSVIFRRAQPLGFWTVTIEADPVDVTPFSARARNIIRTNEHAVVNGSIPFTQEAHQQFREALVDAEVLPCSFEIGPDTWSVGSFHVVQMAMSA